MARARNIKPGFFTNDILAEASPLARILFAGLWCLADREGRLIDRPKKIKAELLPYDQCDADELLNSLESLGFILRYKVEGTGFIQVLNFNKHQNPHVKEQASDIPAPCKPCASTMQAPCKPDETPEVAGLIPDSLIPDSLIPETGVLTHGIEDITTPQPPSIGGACLTPPVDNLPDPVPEPPVLPTGYGLICKTLVSLGVSGVNPSRPDFRALVDAGADDAEFSYAAREAVSRGKASFAYVIGTVRKRREEAAKLVLHKGRLPNRQEALEQSNMAATSGWQPRELREKTA